MENTKLIAGSIVKVLLSLASDGYDYIIPDNDNFSIGDLVYVPFRNKQVVGVIISQNDKPLDYDISKVKFISSKINDAKLSLNQLNFIKKVAEYNLNYMGNILKMVIGFDEIFFFLLKNEKRNYIISYIYVNLSD